MRFRESLPVSAEEPLGSGGAALWFPASLGGTDPLMGSLSVPEECVALHSRRHVMYLWSVL